MSRNSFHFECVSRELSRLLFPRGEGQFMFLNEKLQDLISQSEGNYSYPTFHSCHVSFSCKFPKQDIFLSQALELAVSTPRTSCTKIPIIFGILSSLSSRPKEILKICILLFIKLHTERTWHCRFSVYRCFTLSLCKTSLE